MAGNHFKGSDSGRPAVPPRPNGAGKAGTPGGAGQGGSGKRVSPGETAMFTALYEQSQKAKKTGRARGNVFADGATSASQPSGAPSVPANNAGAVRPPAKTPMTSSHRMMMAWGRNGANC